MSRAGVLTMARRAAEEGMPDVCAVTRSGVGAPVFNPTTGQYTYPDATDVYVGRCKVQIRDGHPDSADLGERAVVVTQVFVHVPVTAGGIQAGDFVEITESAHDPDLVGKLFTVAAGHAKSYGSARRIPVEEVTVQ